MTCEQSFNEALLKLCVLMYQADGKITLTEQEYMLALKSNFAWQGQDDIEVFHASVIPKIRSLSSIEQQKKYLRELREALSFNAQKALAVANGISHIDGDFSEQESELLDYLQYRVLAKHLQPSKTTTTYKPVHNQSVDMLNRP